MVDLRELRERVEEGNAPRARAGNRQSSCRNPECRNGLTPGLAAVGGGDKGRPLFGDGGTGAKRLMRWTWVRCLACNPPDDARRAGAIYKHLSLSEEQMAQRAELATSKAPYAPVSERLGTLSRRATPGAAPSPAQNNEQLTKLLEQISQLNQTVMKLTNQLGDLMEENRTLRKQMEAQKPVQPTPA